MSILIKWIIVIVGIAILLYFAIGLLNNPNTEKPIGGDRDKYGCLIGGGYAYDENIGACTRDFELTPDIKQAAKLAVEKVGKSYALTVVSFNSYEEIGAYDITLESGLERTKQTIYIRNWKVTDKKI